MAKKKYYVVWAGRTTGIFDNWEAVSISVSKFPGAKHKSFKTLGEAQEAYGNASAETHATLSAVADKTEKSHPKCAEVFDPSFDVHIYCDGGCDPNPGEAASGIVVYESGDFSEMYFGLYESMGTNNTAELNALHTAMIIASDRLANGQSVKILSDSTYAVNAMTTWGANWERAGWMDRQNKPRANSELISRMFTLYCEIGSRIKIAHVKAHSGIQGNELADRMCTLAIRGKVAGLERYEGLSIQELLTM